jgi:hypothetical protein
MKFLKIIKISVQNMLALHLVAMSCTLLRKEFVEKTYENFYIKKEFLKNISSSIMRISWNPCREVPASNQTFFFWPKGRN